jgi:hypothetical protein
MSSSRALSTLSSRVVCRVGQLTLSLILVSSSIHVLNFRNLRLYHHSIATLASPQKHHLAPTHLPRGYFIVASVHGRQLRAADSAHPLVRDVDAKSALFDEAAAQFQPSVPAAA